MKQKEKKSLTERKKFTVGMLYLGLMGLCLSVVSCDNMGKEKVGVAFTFDDISIDEWYAHRSLYQKYNIRATFFISNFHLLDSGKTEKLKILASDGHEIACHGLKHENALDFQTEDYINQEVMPALQILRGIGFEPTVFAYPFGTSTSELDSCLLNYFKVLRKATYNIQDTTIDKYAEIYANSGNYRVVNAMGIDYNYGITEENFKTGIKRARKNNEILILYAHVINTSKEDYTVAPEYLEKLFVMCQKYKVKSVTMSEMYDYFRK
jgi:peptidoglycan/xylan/chitin deacetylase (PgdA/CDA1 family)